MEKYFQLLGVNHQSTIDDIEKAYQSRLKALDVLPVDDEAYIKVKRKRLKEAYYAVLLHQETGKVLPDDFEGGADAVEQMLVKARLEKNEIPDSAKVKIKNKGKDVAIIIAFLIGLFVAAEVAARLAVELGPNKKIDPEQYVYLHAYEQAEENDIYIGKIAAASKKYIEDYAVKHPKDNTVQENNIGNIYKSDRWEKKFIKRYWGHKSFEEVADYLCETYEGYLCDSSYIGTDKAIYAFYGFIPYDDIIGYVNPFTGKVFYRGYEIYKFYVKFYEAYQNGEIPE